MANVKVQLALLLLLVGLLAFTGCSSRESVKSDYETVYKQFKKVKLDWWRSRPRFPADEEAYDVYLVIDTQIPAIWIERGGIASDAERVDLPAGYTWSMIYADPIRQKPLSGKIWLKQQGNKSLENDYPESLLSR